MKVSIVWFRRDLRLADNPALLRALATSDRVVPVYVHAPVSGGTWCDGRASQWWLHHSLKALDDALRRLGSRLVIRRGGSFQQLAKLMSETGAEAIYWNRQYEPTAVARDTEIKSVLRAEGFTAESFNGSLLHEPWTVTASGGGPFRVFTPFWTAAKRLGIDQVTESAPDALPPVADEVYGLSVEALGLLPRIPWDSGFYEHWTPGEEGAHRQLAAFLGGAVETYGNQRDIPGIPGTSRLSPHLHWGEISPRQIVASVRASGPAGEKSGSEAFIRELGWREFAYHLIHHFPHTTDEPLDPRFAAFPWPDAYGDELAAWQAGRTGIPLVDAGMAELWQTGWMHNRVRMIAASLLTKNLLVPWQEGAKWFWDTLVDADLACNTLGWQWVAGCGADAAPYFRIFNPVLQGQRFDPEGAYVRRWVPALARVPAAFIHNPWEAPPPVLAAAGVELGSAYPRPMLDLRVSRERALAAFAEVKGAVAGGG